MSIDALSTLLREAQHEVHRHQFANALKVIRDAKIYDLNNLYLAALEHFVAQLPYPSSPGATEEHSREIEQMLSLFIDRAVSDRMRRDLRRPDAQPVPDERTLLLEKVKNQYFQRTDQFIQAKEYERAVEEVQRIYSFDPANIVAKEYQQKIAQLAELNRK